MFWTKGSRRADEFPATFQFPSQYKYGKRKNKHDGRHGDPQEGGKVIKIDWRIRKGNRSFKE